MIPHNEKGEVLDFRLLEHPQYHHIPQYLNEDYGKTVQRKENSLGSLTSRFMELIQKDGVDCLDLNEAAAVLDVQKRRIYDITNVLEGIGLIEKTSKSKIVWKGCYIDMSLPKGESYLHTLAEVEKLRREEAMLDEQTKEYLEEIKKMLDNSDHAYVENAEIRNLPTMKDKTILAVRATHGTHLEVPNPDQDTGMNINKRKYQIYLKSESPIDVFLVSESVSVKEKKQFPTNNEFESYIDEENQIPIELPKDYIFNTITDGEGISDYL